jgi:hypothetical protein
MVCQEVVEVYPERTETRIETGKSKWKLKLRLARKK